MYEPFFGFTERPFTLLPDPDFLFLTTKHRKALTMLEYGITSQAGFTVITGDIGSGKTTLIRKLLQTEEPSTTVGLINNTQAQSVDELLRWVAFAFNLDYSGRYHVELYDVLAEFLIREYAESRKVVLIIDEAQHLGVELLEQVRMLSNINADKHQVIQIILVGQPDLRDLLRRPELHQFAQRIGVDYHIQALDRDEGAAYIRHRLQVAGGDPGLFTADACELIWRQSRGVPRLINVLCDTALVYAFSDQRHSIDLALAEDVVRDRHQGLAPIGEFHAMSAGLSDESESRQPAAVGSQGNMIERLFGN